MAAITRDIWVFTLAFCTVEMAGILSNICSNVAISRLFVQQSHKEAWIKATYLCFAIGAFITPIMVNGLGEVAYKIYPGLAIILTLAMLLSPQPSVETS